MANGIYVAVSGAASRMQQLKQQQEDDEMRAMNRSGASNSARVPDWEQLRYRVVADIACGASVVACTWD